MPGSGRPDGGDSTSASVFAQSNVGMMIPVASASMVQVGYPDLCLYLYLYRASERARRREAGTRKVVVIG